MTAGEIAAIYASVASTCALGWQVYSWKRSRSMQIEVRVAVGRTGPPRERLVAITAVNRSEYPVRVIIVGLCSQDARLGTARRPDVTGRIPGPVPARDTGIAHFFVGELVDAGFDVTQPIAGFVRLSTGERIEAKPQPLVVRKV